MTNTTSSPWDVVGAASETGNIRLSLGIGVVDVSMVEDPAL